MTEIITAVLKLIGKLFADNPEGEHLLKNSKNTYPTGGTPNNANVLRLVHVSQTGSVAAVFGEESTEDYGAVGYQKGTGLNAFYLNGAVYLAGGHWNNGALVPGPIVPVILGQEGIWNGNPTLTARLRLNEDWSITINTPEGQPVITIPPSGNKVKFHVPIETASGATID